MADKIMAYGRELLTTPDTLGIHTGTSASTKLDVPLVADKVGKYGEEDISKLENLSEVTSVTRTKITDNQFHVAETNGYLYLINQGSAGQIVLDEEGLDVCFSTSLYTSGAYFGALFVQKGLKYKLLAGTGFWFALNP